MSIEVKILLAVAYVASIAAAYGLGHMQGWTKAGRRFQQGNVELWKKSQ